ncbi:MAG: GtrA family protein [Janthinobacterium sp.]
MILRFGIISGAGWLIDFSLFSLLGYLGTPVWLANMIGATTAVVCVFFISVRRVFEYQGHYLIRKLFYYIAYQACAILVASLMISALASGLGLMPILAKIIVTPLTFYANFQAMSLITTKRWRFFGR